VHDGVTSINSRAPTLTYPSHPVLSEGVQSVGTDAIPDPRGWTYSAVIDGNCDDQGILSSFFPDLGLWSCNAPGTCVAPFQAHQTALFLTATSTSLEHDIAPTITPEIPSPSTNPVAKPAAPTATQQPIVEQTTSPKNVGAQTPSILSPTLSPLASTPQITPVPSQPGPDRVPTPPTAPQPVGPASGLKAESPAPKGESTAHATPVVVGSGDRQSVSIGAASASPLAESPNILPTVLVPIPTTFNDAQGKVIVSTALAAASPVFPTSGIAEGKPVFSTPSPFVGPVPVIVSSTNAQGSLVLSTSTAAAIAVLITTTNAQGQPMVSTSVSTVPVTASIPTVISSTNDRGILVSSTSFIQAVVLTTVNNQGSQTLITSPVLPATVVNGKISQNFPSSPTGPVLTVQPALTVAAQIVTPNAQSQYIFGSQTLTPGGVITVDGTRISLTPSGTEAVVGTVTAHLTSGLVPAITAPPGLTIGTQTITPNVQGQYVVGTQTLTPGGVITASGTRISLAPGGTQAVVGSITEQLTSGLVPALTAPPNLTIGTQAITPNAQGQYVVGTQTLSPGGVITVSGTAVSLVPGGSYAIVGTSTEALGPYILGGLGAPSGSGVGLNGTRPQAFTGGARSRHKSVWVEGLVGLMGLGVVMWL